MTHDVIEARRLADYLVIMRAGRIEQQGELERVLTAPANDYVERLVGEQL